MVRVGRYSQNLSIQLLELLVFSTESKDLSGAYEGEVEGIEEHHYPLLSTRVFSERYVDKLVVDNSLGGKICDYIAGR